MSEEKKQSTVPKEPCPECGELVSTFAPVRAKHMQKYHSAAAGIEDGTLKELYEIASEAQKGFEENPHSLVASSHKDPAKTFADD